EGLHDLARQWRRSKARSNGSSGDDLLEGGPIVTRREVLARRSAGRQDVGIDRPAQIETPRTPRRKRTADDPHSEDWWGAATPLSGALARRPGPSRSSPAAACRR